MPKKRPRKTKYTFENKGRVIMSKRSRNDLFEIAETNKMSGSIYWHAKGGDLPTKKRIFAKFKKGKILW